MNRKQRRAAQSEGAAAGRGKLAAAPRPRSAQEHNDLACMLLQQGRRVEAARHFARALALMPELFEQYSDLLAMLRDVNPAINGAITRIISAWPRRLRAEEMLGAKGIGALSRDPLLRCMLECCTVRDIYLERCLAAVRELVLEMAANAKTSRLRIDDSTLEFCCALARQCFINEYVFEVRPEEAEQAQSLRDGLAGALAAQGRVSPLTVAAVAAYFPLADVPGSEQLLQREWPSAVGNLLRQQLIEPQQERELRGSMPRLTEVRGEVSRLVQQQYEENPYPRWVSLPSDRGAVAVTEHLRQQFPMAPFRELANGGDIDVLVAGCGTGHQALMTARRLAGARVLAIDLSLPSLCYAKRMAGVFDVRNVEFAQADIAELAAMGRSFHVIEASGVLHHMADPMEGWRVLLSLLRADGFMHVGLYSKAARLQIVAARAFFAGRGLRPTPSDIRRCRRELLDTPMRSIASSYDYFSISECRDLLFHVQEHHFSIPEIASFLREHKLHFIGFEFSPQTTAAYQSRFPQDPSGTNLDCWQAFEAENPNLFRSMYQFWVQRL